MTNCKYCRQLTNDKKYCNMNCYRKSGGHSRAGRIGGNIGGHNSQKTLKRLKLGLYNEKVRKLGQSLGGKIGGHIAQKTLKKLKLGFYNPENARKGHETRRKNKLGTFFNPELNRLQRINMRRFKYKKYGIVWDSKLELEFAINIYYQLKIRLIEHKNVHFCVKLKEFDFFIMGIFIEVHPTIGFHNETELQYYIRRRKILNNGGYSKNKLIVIQ